MSCGIFKIFNLIKRKKILLYLTIIILGIIWISQEIPQIKTPTYKEYPEFTNYLKNNEIKEGIWISNPIFIVNSNKKPNELIYYPLYNSKKIDKLKEKLPNAKYILIDTCDILPCPPTDKTCPLKTNDFLSNIKNNFETIHHKKENNCEQHIFKTIS